MNKDLKQAWSECMRIFKDNLSAVVYSTWFETITPLSLDGNNLTLQIPSQFFYEYLEENYIDIMSKTLRHVFGPEVKLHYSIMMENNNHIKATPRVEYPSINKVNVDNRQMPIPHPQGKDYPSVYTMPGLKKISINPNLKQELTFDNYIEGECNKLARSAGFAVACNPGKTSFNPLFIYGDSGLGKTHLAQAIGIETKKRFSDKIVLYVTANQFQNQYTNAVINKELPDFIHYYQMIDVLIIDDVHEFIGKEKTQETFFQIFNYLHQNGRQLILTSDKAPVDMQGMMDRLISRFKWGLIADLQVPDYETRLDILKRKVYNDGIQEISDNVLEYVALHVSTNVRELEGALISLMAQSILNKHAITMDLAKQQIDKLVKNTSRELSIDYIQKIVCDYFDLPSEAITSKTRKREIVQARQIAMYFAKNKTKLSLATIGSQIGGKDHATVLHACKTVNNLIDTDRQFKNYIEEIERKLKS
ncbi:MAG: chromosomal replication initiator protein DnaA [Salinivirgaceae bacterium]|nr:chromosomal replication initiator protein DnaA [Salinivirgaceae bacterium]